MHLFKSIWTHSLFSTYIVPFWNGLHSCLLYEQKYLELVPEKDADLCHSAD